VGSLGSFGASVDLLCRFVLRSSVTVLYCVLQCCTVCVIVLHCVCCGVALCVTVLHCVLECSRVTLCVTVLHCVLQCCIALCYIVELYDRQSRSHWSPYK
jgi:hypothetical protein